MKYKSTYIMDYYFPTRELTIKNITLGMMNALILLVVLSQKGWLLMAWGAFPYIHDMVSDGWNHYKKARIAKKMEVGSL